MKYSLWLYDHKQTLLLQPDPSVYWISRTDAKIFPEEMATSYIMNTLVMIWHHTTPEYMKLREYHSYFLNPKIYTDEFMEKVFRQLLLELKKRCPLGINSTKILDKMRIYARRLPK